MTKAKNIIFTVSAVLGVAIRVAILINNIRRIYEYERNGREFMAGERDRSSSDGRTQGGRSIPARES